jgi:hypothetical protein
MYEAKHWREDTMKNDFLEQFSENMKFSYTCFDRVIIRGYIRNFFFTSGVVLFLRSLGFHKVSKGVLRILTDQLNSHIKKEADKHHIPIEWWPAVDGGTNGNKLRYVQKHYAKKYKGMGNFTYCILTDNEPVQTYSSKEVTTKRGKKFHRLYKCRKPVKQYYIYFHDKVLGGPCYLKISSYIPFHCEFYFNGHNAIRHKLEQKGISYKMKDNAFVDVADVDALDTAAKDIQGKVVQERITYWMDRFFRFDKGKYSTTSKHCKHDWYMSQVEVCSNSIFKSARYCTKVFERLLDKFSRIGLPDSICKIFTQRLGRSHSKSTCRLYDNNACLKHWFRGNSIKLYNKLGYLIRGETTINNPKSLGHKLQKPVQYLQAYLWFCLGCNDRFFNCCADVDPSSIPDGQADLFTKPVLDSKGRSVTAPDLRKDKQVALCKELLKPKYAVHGFKTADLVANLPDQFRNSAQIRHELKKLTFREVVKKKKGKSFYTVTQNGYKWLWLTITSHSHFKEPIISLAYKKEINQSGVQMSKIEESYRLINQGLSILTQELALVA